MGAYVPQAAGGKGRGLFFFAFFLHLYLDLYTCTPCVAVIYFFLQSRFAAWTVAVFRFFSTRTISFKILESQSTNPCRRFSLFSAFLIQNRFKPETISEPENKKALRWNEPDHFDFHFL